MAVTEELIPPPASRYARIAPGDRGTVPAIVVKDWGDVIQVEIVADGIGGGTISSKVWVARRDFVPSPPLQP
jgi:hypothetical protein